ncbi:Mitogen-activated protein kinase 19 [Linum grandiflorum]
MDTISGVRNDKARKYLTEMRKKQPVPFAQKFPTADPLALRLLQRLLAFDPKDRPTAEEALADPYFRGLSKIEREPSCQPISKLEFEFERRRVTKEDVRELLYREILEYHPQLLKDYISGNEGSNFLYPSAIGHFRKQFAYLEENSGRSAPVIPLERKHVSLPRPTVHASTMSHNMPSSTSVDNHQVTDEVSKNFRGTDGNPGNASRTLRPPPRGPTGTAAKPGRVVGSFVQCGDSNRNMNDARLVYRNTILPSQTTVTSSPPCFFRTNSATRDRDNLSHGRPLPQMVSASATKPVGTGMVTDMNTNPYYQQQQARVVVEHQHQQMNERIAIDAKLIQAQTHYGPAGAAAIAVAAHRNVGTVHYGMS